MKIDLNFPFIFLQCSGGGAKVLVSVSALSSWIWTPQQVRDIIYWLTNIDLTTSFSASSFIKMLIKRI